VHLTAGRRRGGAQGCSRVLSQQQQRRQLIGGARVVQVALILVRSHFTASETTGVRLSRLMTNPQPALNSHISAPDATNWRNNHSRVCYTRFSAIDCRRALKRLNTLIVAIFEENGFEMDIFLVMVNRWNSGVQLYMHYD
jgi:hypothetical protein